MESVAAVEAGGMQNNNLHDLRNDLEDVEDYMDATDDFTITPPAATTITTEHVDGVGSVVHVVQTKNYRSNTIMAKLRKHSKAVAIVSALLFILLIVIIVAAASGGNKKKKEDVNNPLGGHINYGGDKGSDGDSDSDGGDGDNLHIPPVPNFDGVFIEDYRPLLDQLYDLYDRHDVKGKDNLDPETSHGANETPQNKAFFWLAADLKIQPDMDHTQMIQRYVLTVLYFATNAVPNVYYKTADENGRSGPYPWKSAYGWLHKQTECNWRGIVCDGRGNIVEIAASDNHMSGRIPQELGFLGDHMKSLDLSGNYIYLDDELDKESDYTLLDIADDETNSFDVFTKLINLEYLNIADNYVVTHNGLPTEFSTLEKLQKFDLSRNMLNGHFDRPKSSFALSKLTQLTSLRLGDNKLNGGVPGDVLGMLSNLHTLHLGDNDLTFNLDFIKSGQLTNLKTLFVGYNTITGVIPTEIGLLTSLEKILLNKCMVGGPIPTEMGNLVNLIALSASENVLTGQIPTELSNLSNLEILELHGNSITGSVPQGICEIINASTFEYKALTADCADELSSVQCSSDTCCTKCY